MIKKKKLVCEDVSKVIKDHKKFNDQLLVTGDFNWKVGNLREDKIVGPYGLGIRNDNGSRLIEFCKRHDLTITNTWFEQKETRRHTWISPDGVTKNQIDYVLVNQRYRNSITNSKSRKDMDCGSAHTPVSVKMKLRFKKKL